MCPVLSTWRVGEGQWVLPPLVPITASWSEPADHAPWYDVNVSGYLVCCETDVDGNDYAIIASAEVAAPPPESPIFLGPRYFQVWRAARSLTINGEVVG